MLDRDPVSSSEVNDNAISYDHNSEAHAGLTKYLLFRLEDEHYDVAPGDHHLRVHEKTDSRMIELSQEEAVNRFRPSVDVLFESLKKVS
jgi:hypothetical protein